MPLYLLFAALCSGLVFATVWMVFGGTGLSIIAVYILSGHLAMAAMLLLAAMRGVR